VLPAFPPLPTVLATVLLLLDVVPPVAEPVEPPVPLVGVPVEPVVDPPAPTAPLVPVPAVALCEPPAPPVSASSSPCAQDPVAAKNANPTMPMPKNRCIARLMSQKSRPFKERHPPSTERSYPEGVAPATIAENIARPPLFE